MVIIINNNNSQDLMKTINKLEGTCNRDLLLGSFHYRDEYITFTPITKVICFRLKI